MAVNLDLHGYARMHAINLVQQTIFTFLRNENLYELNIITGRGLH